MVAYSFKKQFREPIISGSKRQTIRGLGKRRHGHRGDALQLYTGMRTKHCERILPFDVPCTSNLITFMYFDKGEIVNITVDGLAVHDMDAFAVADGFQGLSEMTEFWHKNHRCADYTGSTLPLVLVQWDPSKRLEPKSRARKQ